MDDIDKAKLGKKDERLVGWDWIRKPKMNTNYPPMRAKGAKEKPHLCMGTPVRHEKGNEGWFLIALLILAFAITKVLGFW
jgi:hypothetical protein